MLTKVYVISLKRAPERRSSITKQLESLGLDFEMIDAVDYQELKDTDFERLCDAQAVAQQPFLTKGMRACALSHVKALNKMIADGAPAALILEDDAILPADIKELLLTLGSELRKNEVIALSYHSHRNEEICLSTQNSIELGNERKLMFPIDVTYMASTMAYMVSLPVAQKMVSVMMPISELPDSWGGYFRKGAFQAFRCVYPVVVKPAPFRSTLDHIGTKTLKSAISSLIRRYKLPFFNTLLEKRSQKLVEEKYAYRFTNRPPQSLRMSY